MLRRIVHTVNDFARVDDELPIRIRHHRPHACVVPAEGKAVIKRSIRIVADYGASRVIAGSVDVEKQDVFVVRQNNASGWGSLRGEKRRVELSIQQNRAAGFGSRLWAELPGVR